MEFLLADALRQNSTCIITCGSLNSNHCRATAVASKRLGLECHLLLRSHDQVIVLYQICLNRHFSKKDFRCNPEKSRAVIQGSFPRGPGLKMKIWIIGSSKSTSKITYFDFRGQSVRGRNKVLALWGISEYLETMLDLEHLTNLDSPLHRSNKEFEMCLFGTNFTLCHFGVGYQASLCYTLPL